MKRTFPHALNRCFRVMTVLVLFSGVVFSAAAGERGCLTYREMIDSLEQITKTDKSITRLESLGKTLEDRDIWLLEIAGKNDVPVGDRPALFIAAGIDGSTAAGTSIALTVAERLVSGYGSDETVTSRLDECAVYIVPRLSPDACERMFDDVVAMYGTNMRPFDDDNDGRIDEDGPEDLNGDGIITFMRVPDSQGMYMIDPDDPRLMKKADPLKGETGTHRIFHEGIDNDGDGYVNEDARGGVDISRNFQHAYPYYARGAGPHMVSELESRAVMDWLLAHRNVAMILTIGEGDNLIEPLTDKGALVPGAVSELSSFAEASFDDIFKDGMFSRPRQGRRGDGAPGGESDGAIDRLKTVVADDDIVLFRDVAEKYGELTGIQARPPLCEPTGTLFQFGYYQYGVPSFSTPGWGIDKDESARIDDADDPDSETKKKSGTETMDAALLSWMNRVGAGDFVDWTACDHPGFDGVEVGGFRPFAITNPPADSVQALGERHAEFVLDLISRFARITITDATVTDYGGGVFKITAVVGNGGYLPTSLAHGVTARTVKPSFVRLDIDPASIVSGDEKMSFFHALPGSGGCREFEWIVTGRKGDTITLEVVSRKAGRDSRTLKLQ